MSQCSGHEFWHFKKTTIELLWITVYPFSFTKRHIDRRIHNIFRFWFSLCHKFPCADEQFNVLSGCFFCRFCDVFVDTIHNANPWNCSVFQQWFDHDINATTPFVRIEFHIQDWADLRIWTNPPSRSGCFEILRLCVFSTRCLHNHRSFLNCDEELSFLNLLKERSIFAKFRQFLIFRKFCEFLEIILQQVSLCRRCWALRCGVTVGTLSRCYQRFTDLTFSIIWI